ncbi:LexA family transcriptional regulator [Shewanella sp. M16]|uniref:XRE family transcriptional regulator n=1 Tax=Shewanella sp. M16 TaxID=2830837 RepID=UPI001BAF6CBB|nr:XRE family transcriptional regulator [Shewanella sp. M16]MBS0045206.1 LexA family transcriptional regulator [Shewanella sp. M16]
MDSFKERLKRLREARGLTQGELAKNLPSRVTAVAISQWETGITEPKMANLKALADFFEVGIEWLSSGRILQSDISFEDLNTVIVPNAEIDPKKAWAENYLQIDSKLLINKDNIAWFEVEGDSMSPLFNDRDILFIDTDFKTIRDGGMYLVLHDTFCRVRSLSQTLTGYSVKPINDAYLTEHYNQQKFFKEFKILGKVISKFCNI